MSETILELQNVSKAFRIYHEKRNSIYEALTGMFRNSTNYEKLEVLKDVTFSLNRGEMLAIMGRNGAGKSTILRIIAGIYKPDKGRIVKKGTLVPFFSLGAGFQPELTATANILLYGVLLGLPKKKIREEVDEILQFAELEKFADVKIKNFSAGMHARLAFSTAMKVDPDLILMDEILSVGDIAFQQKSYKAFLDFKKKGKSIILVTHSINPVKDYCDRAVFLNNGRVEVTGKPQDVIDAYTKASFVDKSTN